ncbi:MAG: hypothetical protein HY329_20855 [Chloroflexi bacterium]|nr:hypothetical protein [Chloroflexota bacterium]
MAALFTVSLPVDELADVLANLTAELTEIQQTLAEIGTEAEYEPMRCHAAAAAALVKMAAQATAMGARAGRL